MFDPSSCLTDWLFDPHHDLISKIALGTNEDTYYIVVYPQWIIQSKLTFVQRLQVWTIFLYFTQTYEAI